MQRFGEGEPGSKGMCSLGDLSLEGASWALRQAPLDGLLEGHRVVADREGSLEQGKPKSPICWQALPEKGLVCTCGSAESAPIPPSSDSQALFRSAEYSGAQNAQDRVVLGQGPCPSSLTSVALGGPNTEGTRHVPELYPEQAAWPHVLGDPCPASDTSLCSALTGSLQLHDTARWHKNRPGVEKHPGTEVKAWPETAVHFRVAGLGLAGRLQALC